MAICALGKFYNNWLSLLYFYPVGFYLYFKNKRITMKKLVSILVNCHNGEKYLNEAIDSILKQSYQNFEIIFSTMPQPIKA